MWFNVNINKLIVHYVHIDFELQMSWRWSVTMLYSMLNVRQIYLLKDNLNLKETKGS